MEKSIIKISGELPGKTVAVFAGVHGNEKAGILAIQEIIEILRIDSGTAYFVLANPPAIEQGVRFIEKNLNRRFYRYVTGKSWEDKRARALITLLNKCDALLDLHGYNGEEDTPFIITSDPTHTLVSSLNIPIVITGFDQIGRGGSDWYMSSCGKLGICLECGSNYRPEEYVLTAKEAIFRFLEFYQLIAPAQPRKLIPKIIFRVVHIVKRKSKDFKFARMYRNFEKLVAKEPFAWDGATTYRAQNNQYILFPRPNQKIGHEAFIVLEKI